MPPPDLPPLRAPSRSRLQRVGELLPRVARGIRQGTTAMERAERQGEGNLWELVRIGMGTARAAIHRTDPDVEGDGRSGVPAATEGH